MIQKIVVAICSLFCIVVWSVVLFLFMQQDSPIAGKNVSKHQSALTLLDQPKDRTKIETPPELLAMLVKKELEEKQKELNQNGKINKQKIRIEGITKEELQKITDTKTVSVDTLLYALGINPLDSN